MKIDLTSAERHLPRLPHEDREDLRCFLNVSFSTLMQSEDTASADVWEDFTLIQRAWDRRGLPLDS